MYESRIIESNSKYSNGGYGVLEYKVGIKIKRKRTFQLNWSGHRNRTDRQPAGWDCSLVQADSILSPFLLHAWGLKLTKYYLLRTEDNLPEQT